MSENITIKIKSLGKSSIPPLGTIHNQPRFSRAFLYMDIRGWMRIIDKGHYIAPLNLLGLSLFSPNHSLNLHRWQITPDGLCILIVEFFVADIFN